MVFIILNMAESLSKRQKSVLEFIRRRIIQDNLPPTIREIARQMGFSSTGTVRDYLRTLESKGYLKTNYNEEPSSLGYILAVNGDGYCPICLTKLEAFA